MTKKQMIYEMNLARGWKNVTAKRFYAYAMNHTKEETQKEFERITRATNYGIKNW